jgi:branched-chain amino acid transport system permease protein
VFMITLPGGLLPEGFNPLRGRGRRRAAVPDEAVVTSPGESLATPALAGAVNGSATATTRANGHGDGKIALTASGLTKHFGGIRAADGLDLELRNGQVTGLIGPNGAGKTTVFNILTRVIVPDAGEVKLGDQVLGEWPTNRIAANGMSRSYQDVRIFARMSVVDNVMLAVPRQPGEKLLNVLFRPLRVQKFEHETRRKAMEHLEFVGLAEEADLLAGSLPFGDQKLLALARLLATESDVLLLDEPASGIDIDGVERMLDLIAQLRDRGKCVCIVEHNLHVVERVADRVYFMEAGKITAEGTMEELMKQERLSEVYFGSA